MCEHCGTGGSGCGVCGTVIPDALVGRAELVGRVIRQIQHGILDDVADARACKGELLTPAEWVQVEEWYAGWLSQAAEVRADIARLSESLRAAGVMRAG